MSNHRTTLIIAAAAFLLNSGCEHKPESRDPGTTQQERATSGRPVAQVTGVEIRPDRAPNFTWRDATGMTYDFDSFRGKITLVNFWATWCGPCLNEIPDLIALADEFAGRDVKILGISVDRGPNILTEVESFVREKKINYPVIIASEELASAFGNVRAIPTSFIIDREGKIAQTIVGARPRAFFSKSLTALAD